MVRIAEREAQGGIRDDKAARESFDLMIAKMRDDKSSTFLGGNLLQVRSTPEA